MQVIGYTDVYWAGSPIDRHSTTGYCILVGGKLISWESKKQDVVARSSAKAGYQAMAMATCELIWLKQLLNELHRGLLIQSSRYAIIKLHSTLPPIQSFMRGLSTLKLIVTCERKVDFQSH